MALDPFVLGALLASLIATGGVAGHLYLAYTQAPKFVVRWLKNGGLTQAVESIEPEQMVEILKKVPSETWESMADVTIQKVAGLFNQEKAKAQALIMDAIEGGGASPLLGISESIAEMLGISKKSAATISMFLPMILKFALSNGMLARILGPGGVHALMGQMGLSPQPQVSPPTGIEPAWGATSPFGSEGSTSGT